MQNTLAAIIAAGFLVLLLLPARTDGAASEHEQYSQLVLQDLENLESKLVGLAQAIPSEKFSWRPDPDARSVSEIFAHVASANYFMVKGMGTTIPRGAFRGHMNLEELTARDDVIAVLRASFEHARIHVKNKGADPVPVSLEMLNHAHEHLGQAIAYARTLGVTPPWRRDGSGH